VPHLVQRVTQSAFAYHTNITKMPLFKRFVRFVIISLSLLITNAQARTVLDFIEGDARFTTFVVALKRTGVYETLSLPNTTFTVFAPTNHAFRKANCTDCLVKKYWEHEWRGQLRWLCNSHIIMNQVLLSSDFVELGLGQTFSDDLSPIQSSWLNINSLDPLEINYAKVIGPDRVVDNGVVHVVDDVLQDYYFEIEPYWGYHLDGTFRDWLYIAGLYASDVYPNVFTSDQYTIFEPTEDAFDALDSGTRAALMADPMGFLRSIMLYHIVPGQILAEDMVNGTRLRTMYEGAEVTASIVDGRLMVNDAVVVRADWVTMDAVVHYIDRLLIPKNDTPSSHKPTDMPDEEATPNITQVTARAQPMAMPDDKGTSTTTEDTPDETTMAETSTDDESTSKNDIARSMESSSPKVGLAATGFLASVVALFVL